MSFYPQSNSRFKSRRRIVIPTTPAKAFTSDDFTVLAALACRVEEAIELRDRSVRKSHVERQRAEQHLQRVQHDLSRAALAAAGGTP